MVLGFWAIWSAGRRQEEKKEKKLGKARNLPFLSLHKHCVEKRRKEKKGEAVRLRSLPPLLDHLLSFALLG